MGIKGIDINKDGITLGDHIENMKEKPQIFLTETIPIPTMCLTESPIRWLILP